MMERTMKTKIKRPTKFQKILSLKLRAIVGADCNRLYVEISKRIDLRRKILDQQHQQSELKGNNTKKSGARKISKRHWSICSGGSWN